MVSPRKAGVAEEGVDDVAPPLLAAVPPLPADLEVRGAYVGEVPTVTVALPVLDEGDHIESCLRAVTSQTYPRIVEILVVDGGSRDATRSLAARFAGVRVVDNPGRVQAAGLNVALREARGKILVRVDGRATLAPDYVERCVAALQRSGAALVGGSLAPQGTTWVERTVGAALTSTLGAGPARYRRAHADAAWTDAVYLGAARVDVLRSVGGYDEGFETNEDAELLYRLGDAGGVWFDPTIRSTYRPRDSFAGFLRQYFRYGQGRAATVRKYPRSLKGRQLAAPLLVLGLLAPGRRKVATAYAAVVAVGCAMEMRHDRGAGAGLAVALPVMHLSWGTGFLVGLLRSGRRPR